MLTHINIRNFAIADEVEVEFGPGMTALTGETGAGKSILIDALGLVLGDRADNRVIRHGSERAEISVGFDIRHHAAASDWLLEHELDADGECQLRRIISRAGRSRGFINNQPVPMQSLRELGERLVDIHGQHEHQSLLHTTAQRQLLDVYADHATLLARMDSTYREWAATRDLLEQAMQTGEDRDARLDLLRYQVQELDTLGLTRAELASLDQDHDRLANAEQLLAACRQGLESLNAETGASVYQLLSATLGELDELSRLDNRLEPVTGILNEIMVLVQECTDGIRGYTEGLEVDPGRLHQLEERMSVLHDLARKHHCRPDELPEHHAQLRGELDSLEHADRDIAGLQSRLDTQANHYRKTAEQLSASRLKSARAFGKQASTDMHRLGMPGGVFEIQVTHEADRSFSPYGMDRIEFMVSANPGQPPGPLSKVASGGELSRISLAIQVICMQGDHIPTLIFDEVDTGIGGGVAEIVGQKLRALGKDCQVFCVTHLPQVAALARCHLQVSKLTGEDSTHTRVRQLGSEERVDELARMLGGVEITEQTREHARELLARSQNIENKTRKYARQ